MAKAQGNDLDASIGFKKVENGIVIVTEKAGVFTTYAHMDGSSVSLGDTLSEIVTKMLKTPVARKVVTKKNKGGRPKGSKNKPVTAAPVTGAPPATTDPAAAPEVQPAAPAAPRAKRGAKGKFVTTAVEAPPAAEPAPAEV